MNLQNATETILKQYKAMETSETMEVYKNYNKTLKGYNKTLEDYRDYNENKH